eukprot:1924768-Prymnesium_polylepis.1
MPSAAQVEAVQVRDGGPAGGQRRGPRGPRGAPWAGVSAPQRPGAGRAVAKGRVGVARTVRTRHEAV